MHGLSNAHGDGNHFIFSSRSLSITITRIYLNINGNDIDLVNIPLNFARMLVRYEVVFIRGVTVDFEVVNIFVFLNKIATIPDVTWCDFTEIFTKNRRKLSRYL